MALLSREELVDGEAQEAGHDAEEEGQNRPVSILTGPFGPVQLCLLP